MEAFLLENLPILLCFLFGVILLIVEVFMPGFGLPGISGIVLEGAAIVLTYLWHGGLAALGVTVLILAIVAVAISLALRPFCSPWPEALRTTATSWTASGTACPSMALPRRRSGRWKAPTRRKRPSF